MVTELYRQRVFYSPVLDSQDHFPVPLCSFLLFYSILFPGLIGKITAPPAAPVEKREVSMPLLTANPSTQSLKGSPMDFFSKLFNK